MTEGYIVDDSALVAGLTALGTERHHRELSLLIDGAYHGGPFVEIPALCLTHAAHYRPEIVDHLVHVISGLPFGALGIGEFWRTEPLEEIRSRAAAEGGWRSPSDRPPSV